MPDTLPQPVERVPLSKWQFAMLFLQQQGKCAKCATKLERGNTIDEHLQPLDHLGGNELSNRALYCKPCATVKTKTDLAASWKGKRLRGEVGNGPKRKLQSRNDLGSRKMGVWPKRAFDKSKSRGFDGKVRERI